MSALRNRKFAQVDVFTTDPYNGNPVAVVLDGEGLAEQTMAKFANWTNLSETTFILPATTEDADYRLRIFTPSGELPFAGHPTLGSAHAWLAAAAPASERVIVQECGVGLVEVRHREGIMSFRAPERRREGPLDEEYLARVTRGLRINRGEIVGHQWVDNGPGWAAIQLRSAEDVLSLEPDAAHMADVMLGVIGAYPPGSAHQFEVRAFAAPVGVPEDPVTGSVNAGIAQWLITDGAAPARYTVSQGSRVGRHGVVHVDARDDGIWVGGPSRTCIEGTVLI